MKTYRITKYNPKNRNSEDHYTKDDWVGCSEIGEMFNGKILTPGNYLITENKYVDAAIKFLNILEYNNIYISNLEKNGFNSSEYVRENIDNMLFTYKKVNDNYLVESIEELKLLIKLILRGDIWAEIEILKDSQFIGKIEYGYDYYMYFNLYNSKKDICPLIEVPGLFCEELPI